MCMTLTAAQAGRFCIDFISQLDRLSGTGLTHTYKPRACAEPAFIYFCKAAISFRAALLLAGLHHSNSVFMADHDSQRMCPDTWSLSCLQPQTTTLSALPACRCLHGHCFQPLILFAFHPWAQQWHDRFAWFWHPLTYHSKPVSCQGQCPGCYRYSLCHLLYVL